MDSRCDLIEILLKTVFNTHDTINQSLQTTQIKLESNDLCDWVKHLVEKRRKCYLPDFPSFSTMFSDGFSIGVVKTRGWVVKG